MPGHDGQAGARGAIARRPVVQRKLAFEINARTFDKLVGDRDRALIEHRRADPLRRFAFAAGNVQAQVGLSVFSCLALAVAAKGPE